jgi:hypothetical protein
MQFLNTPIFAYLTTSELVLANSAMLFGESHSARRAMQEKRRGRTHCPDFAPQQHLTYLHEMFWQAANLLGNKASVEELAVSKNVKSTAL